MTVEARRALRRLVLTAALGFGTSAVAQDPASPPAISADRPDLGGIWVLDDSLKPLERAARPGPVTLPRGWRTLAGWANNANTPPPLRPEVRAAIAREQRAELAGRARTPRSAACKTRSFFDFMLAGVPVDIVQRWNEVVTLVGRLDALPRHIQIGRAHPALDDITPAFNGHSIGHWEGDTLIIDTIGFDPAVPLSDADYLPLSTVTHIVERLQLSQSGELRDTMTIDDPTLLTQPWIINLFFHKQPAGSQLAEIACVRDVGAVHVEH